jgi:hypothetical protein
VGRGVAHNPIPGAGDLSAASLSLGLSQLEQRCHVNPLSMEHPLTATARPHHTIQPHDCEDALAAKAALFVPTDEVVGVGDDRDQTGSGGCGCYLGQPREGETPLPGLGLENRRTYGQTIHLGPHTSQGLLRR